MSQHSPWSQESQHPGPEGVEAEDQDEGASDANRKHYDDGRLCVCSHTSHTPERGEDMKEDFRSLQIIPCPGREPLEVDYLKVERRSGEGKEEVSEEKLRARGEPRGSREEVKRSLDEMIYEEWTQGNGNDG
ncbi:hypothetical protein MKZ38_002780 [Zalerion maritima]|uniref:Uncharacterized protein n=1 Tax=Zalerion maritima TaxID=339359 RepID=A0AAD5RNG8_9PEZI|nr:hypothetical protein MKZ38_002780 [Zalerion maritima]